MSKRIKSHLGFTLIELLVVIAIMGILIAFAVPAFESMGRGSAVRSAATQLAATLTFARQQAVVTRSSTYVVFPHLDSSLYSGANSVHADKALRAYAVYSETNGYVRNWTYLPKGVVFVNSKADFPSTLIRDTKSIFANPDSDAFSKKVIATIKFPDTKPATPFKNMRVIAFFPDGGMRSMNGNRRGPDAEIYITEGTVPIVGGMPQTPQYRSVTNSSLFTLSLNPLTGQSKIEDFRYF